MSAALPAPIVRVRPTGWRLGEVVERARSLPEETAVCLSYDRVSHAVMMATPADLEDFALGFSLNEGIIARAADLLELAIQPTEHGIELRMWLAESCGDAFLQRRRQMAGPVGCGLCGLESLAEAMRPPPAVTSDLRLSEAAIGAAVAALPRAQELHRQTGAVHAAGFWTPERGLVELREDVGRHNALDKLAGALARTGRSAAGGAVVMTSRVSIELVQKAAAMGAPVLIAISAPTALAVRAAEAAGMTLIAVARSDGFEVFTHPERLQTRAAHHVA